VTDRPPEFETENHPELQVVENTGEMRWLGGRDSEPVAGCKAHPLPEDLPEQPKTQGGKVVSQRDSEPVAARKARRGASRGPAEQPKTERKRGNWLGGRDSNPDTVVQSHVSYRWTTSQYQPGVLYRGGKPRV
jgi:hypothetical protein